VAQWTARDAQCFVLTFKEGVLSAIAHDLKLAVGSFTIDAEDATHALDARFDARSLRVVCAMRDGREAHEVLSEKDKREIERNIEKDVLDTRRHAEVRFRSTAVRAEGDGFVVEGDLALCGRTRRTTARVMRAGDRYETRVRLHQPDFDIKPYRAMLGALRVQADVEIVLSVPA